MILRRSAVVVALVLLPISASAATVTLEVTNNQPAGGFSITPLWFAFHDGTFDMFDGGMAASAGVEMVAELGDASVLGSEFMASGASGVSGVLASPSGPPPFTPGQTNSMTVDVGDETVNRYFSAAAMFVPSNDIFLGNDDPLGYEIFDASGDFLGPLTIEVYARDLWDAGTEVNDIMDGGAFIVGVDAMGGTSEGGVVTSLFSVSGIDGYLSSIVGLETPAGFITDGLSPDELVATIRIVPEPATLASLLLAGLALARPRRS